MSSSPPAEPSPVRSIAASASPTHHTDPTVDAPAQGGCFARTLLPAGARSAAICSRTADFARTAFTHRQRLAVSVGRDRQVLHFCRDADRAKAVDRQWIAHARLADDMHGNNAVIEVQRKQTMATSIADGRQTAELRVRVLRDVLVGEELQLWFSEELLAMLSIPFLTPAQISIGE